MRLWLRLEEARNIVAETRSSVFLRDVDSVTIQITRLQDQVYDAIVTNDGLPKYEPGL